MRHIGILGGTFDPIHVGHLQMAREAMRLLSLDEVVFMPMARPTHRETVSAISHRLAMCRLAVAGEEGLSVSAIGAAPSMQYTCDTLPLLCRDYPNARFSMLLGADKLSTLPSWREADKLFLFFDFICFPRPGVDHEEALAKARQAGARIAMMPDSVSACSSTAIRQKAALYEDTPEVPVAVLCYMAENGLYQKDLLPALRAMMNPHRFRHTLGVRKEAVRLAALHGAPIQKAALAGLLHDCAKGMSAAESADIARKQNLTDDEGMLSSAAMLHGPVGAYLAQTQFHIQDEDILNAIRSHTIGRPGMSKLELVIFVADATEEGREDYEGLDEIRRLSDISLEEAALCSLRLTEEYLQKSGRPFFPVARETMTYLKTKI